MLLGHDSMAVVVTNFTAQFSSIKPPQNANVLATRVCMNLIVWYQLLNIEVTTAVTFAEYTTYDSLTY